MSPQRSVTRDDAVQAARTLPIIPGTLPIRSSPVDDGGSDLP